jgi:folate-binding protein YgfZ
MDPSAGAFAAIEGGRAFARPQGIRIVRVTGSDAAAWLHDLVTTDVTSLELGQARRSLLLTPTGRIRADFMVGRDRDPDGFWLLQRNDQPSAVHDLLGIYVLSADVVLTEVSAGSEVWTLVGGAADRAEGLGLGPSLLGPGRDVVTPRGSDEPPWADNRPSPDLTEVEDRALERWRILRGDPRMGVDFEEGALPAAVGLDAAIDTAKGCFLGQESVAKIRNLGHPPSLLLLRRATRSVVPAMPVLDAGEEVGIVTSAAPDSGGATVAIIRVAWSSRDAPLTSAEGATFLAVPPLG